MLVRTIFKLKSRGWAILSENDQRSALLIPASALVGLVGGNIDKDTFVKIRYEGKVLLMLTEDLRRDGEVKEVPRGSEVNHTQDGVKAS